MLTDIIMFIARCSVVLSVSSFLTAYQHKKAIQAVAAPGFFF